MIWILHWRIWYKISGSSFDSMGKTTSEKLKNHEIQYFQYCLLPKPDCESKGFVNKPKAENNYSFIWGILGHLHEVYTQRARVSNQNEHFITISTESDRNTKIWTIKQANNKCFRIKVNY